MTTRAASPDRRGFTLIEIMVAMGILSVIVMSLASLTYTVARQSIATSQNQYAAGVSSELAGRLTVIPFNLLPNQVGCTTVEPQPFPHTRCVTVDNISNVLRRVTVVVTSSLSYVRPDTAVFDRAQLPTGNPFNNP